MEFITINTDTCRAQKMPKGKIITRDSLWIFPQKKEGKKKTTFSSSRVIKRRNLKEH